jgi:amidase
VEDALAWETESSGPWEAHNGALRHRTWQRLNEKRLQIREKWEEFFQDFDVLLMPVAQVTAITHDHSKPQRDRVMTVNGAPWPYTDQLAWVGLITMAYLPATSAPAGTAANGLPVGIQIVSGYADDRTTIEFARLLAGVCGGFNPPPGYEE